MTYREALWITVCKVMKWLFYGVAFIGATLAVVGFLDLVKVAIISIPWFVWVPVVVVLVFLVAAAVVQDNYNSRDRRRSQEDGVRNWDRMYKKY